MSKKLICLLLSLIMVLTVCLTACGDNDLDDVIDDTTEEASESAITLSMYLVSEKKVSSEQAAAVQEAINKISQSKFKTKLVLRFFTEDEYYARLEHDLAAEYEEGVEDEDESTPKEDETELTEYGTITIKYPAIADSQVDIFYVSGYDRLMEYVEYEYVEGLGSEIDTSSTILKSYVFPDYITRVDELCGDNYGLPTNAPAGEYTFLLLNKEILAEYNHVASDFVSLTDINTQLLLDLVSKFNTEYVPLRSFTGADELDVINVNYFGVNEAGRLSGDFSVLGGTYNPSWTYLTPMEYTNCSSILSDGSFLSQIRTLTSYKEAGYYGDENDADKPFAVGFMRGGAELYAEYGDEYELVVLERPYVEADDLFSDMFAISSTTTSVTRSMEILTYLYTDEEFRNILLYGVEGENFEISETAPDEDGKTYKYVTRLNEDYMMAPEKTGNVCLMYPLDSQPANLTEYYKLQNSEASTDLLLSFTYEDVTNEAPIIPEHITLLNEYSAELLSNIKSAETVEALNAYISEATAFISSDADLIFAMGRNPKDRDFCTVGSMYVAWLNAHAMIVF